MPKLKPLVVQQKPATIVAHTEFAVLYIRASDNFDAIDCANEWAHLNGFERARELTLSRVKIDGQLLYVGRCYRPDPNER